MTGTSSLPSVKVGNQTAAIVSICLCSFMNAYLMVSVFPYAGFLCIRMIPSANEENAGSYAGLLESSFMVGRTLTSYEWGRLSDRYGRVFVLISSLLLSSLFSVLFGFSKSFIYAVFWRFCLGMSNGMLGCTKTVATEIANGEEMLEQRAMALVIGMRAWGYLFGPAIGGLLAEPLQQYPNFWRGDEWQVQLLTKYPFILPNFLGSICCIIAVVTVCLFLPETLELSKRTSPWRIPADLINTLISSSRQVISRTGSLFSSDDQLSPADVKAILPLNKNDETKGRQKSIWSRLDTRALLISHWIYSFISMAADVAFPLFCMSHRGGLGLNGASIGKILSGAGVLFACAQYAVFKTVVHRFGVHSALVIGSMIGIQPCTLIPSSLVLQDQLGQVTWVIFSLLALLMGIVKTCSCLFFTSLALALNKTVPSEQRGRMNGICNTGGSIARAIAPTMIGLLVSFSFSDNIFSAQYGSLVIYGVLSMLGAVTFLHVKTVVVRIGDGQIK